MTTKMAFKSATSLRESALRVTLTCVQHGPVRRADAVYSGEEYLPSASRYGRRSVSAWSYVCQADVSKQRIPISRFSTVQRTVRAFRSC